MSKKYKKTMLASLMGLDEGITNREILARRKCSLLQRMLKEQLEL